MKFEKYFHTQDGDVYDSVEWDIRDSKITDAEGNVKFEMKGVEVPKPWSQLATDIFASKYCRKSGVPNERGHEWSLKQVVERITDTITAFGLEQRYFQGDDAINFNNDLKWLLINQYGAFNSPVWFNVGLWHKYKIAGTGQNWAFDGVDGFGQPANQYERPQASACFIQSVEDDLLSIFELVKNEASIFKYGGGSGANMSTLRAAHENLAGGGKSSGLISFLKVLDSAAGAIKSGGTCLTANTPILTNEGYNRVVDLVDKNFICFSKNILKDRIEAKKAQAFQSSVKKCVRVTTDKGVFEVSHDHPFLLKDQRYLAADQLKVGMRLEAAYSQISKDGYAQFRLPKSLHMKMHRILARDILDNDIDNKIVHHVDHNRLNNAVNNLKTMSFADHGKLHKDLTPKEVKQAIGRKSIAIQKAQGKHIFSNQKFPKKGANNAMHKNAAFWKNKEKVASYKKKQSELLLNRTEEQRQTMRRNSTSSKMLNSAYHLINIGYDISTQTKFLASRHDYYVKKYKSGFSPKEQQTWGSALHRYFKNYDHFYKELESRNHKVLKVEPIESQIVYDVQVECKTIETRDEFDNHNFLIGNSNAKLDSFEGRGVFVHNTRRAAVLRALDADHPEILDFINWKIKEEEKAEALIKQGYDSDFNGEAYATVSGQNSNNAVRLTDEFMKAVEEDGDWQTTNRTDGKVYQTHKARDIFTAICQAAWRVADPGIQFDTTINKWNTCKESGRQESTNPCSEFSFLNNSACNLASLNLVKFWKDGKFDVESFRRAVRIFITAQDILVDLGSYPTKEIAKNSHEFRPLGLGYSNLGTLLMLAGYPYDSDEGRTLAALITSIMTGTAYETSAELAEKLGAFQKFKENQNSMLDVIGFHSNCSGRLVENDIPENLDYLHDNVLEIWDNVKNKSYRNAQTSLLAPVGTTGLLMDCDTTGIEPAFSLVSHKKLAGGGSIQMVNQSVEEVLRVSGFTDYQIKDMLKYITENNTIEGKLSEKYLPIFDCAMPSGNGKRFISSDGHIKMLAAVQPFLSGAISKTVNVPHDATVQDIWDIFMKSWKLGLKAITVYRDGSKSSQPLNVEKKKDVDEVLTQISKEHSQNVDEILGHDIPKLKWGESRKLPAECVGRRWRFKVGGTKLYLRSGEYEDGTLGEIWIDLEYKEGSTVRSLMNQFAISVSYALQTGVSLQTLVDKFSFTKFEPHGIVKGHSQLKMATSLLDAVFRILSYHYLNNTKQFIPDAPESEEIEYKPITQNIDSGNNAPCSECGSIDFLRTGNCFVCVTCGMSQGCS